MTATVYRYYVTSPDGVLTAGYDKREVAERVAVDFGEGAHIVDTMAMPYHPMAQKIEGGQPVFLEYGGWDIRGGADANLIEAIRKGYAPLARAFLAKGASPDATDANGGTALIWAVARGVESVVRLLIEQGADVRRADAHGMTALALARKRGKQTIAALIEAAGATE